MVFVKANLFFVHHSRLFLHEKLYATEANPFPHAIFAWFLEMFDFRLPINRAAQILTTPSRMGKTCGMLSPGNTKTAESDKNNGGLQKKKPNDGRVLLMWKSYHKQRPLVIVCFKKKGRNNDQKEKGCSPVSRPYCV